MSSIRALTLWQPMAWAISDHTKRIENRPWKPWSSVIGKHIAIHAGSTYHQAHADQIKKVFGVDVPAKADLPMGSIVAVARVVSFVHEADLPVPGQTADALSDPWFSGPFGWILDDVVKLDQPIPCKGAQGLWAVPPPALLKLRAAVMEATRG